MVATILIKSWLAMNKYCRGVLFFLTSNLHSRYLLKKATGMIISGLAKTVWKWLFKSLISVASMLLVTVRPLRLICYRVIPKLDLLTCITLPLSSGAPAVSGLTFLRCSKAHVCLLAECDCRELSGSPAPFVSCCKNVEGALPRRLASADRSTR